MELAHVPSSRLVSKTKAILLQSVVNKSPFLKEAGHFHIPAELVLLGDESADRHGGGGRW